MNTGRKYIKIETTFEKREEAAKLAELILDAKLAGCAQIVEIGSVYNWEGKRCRDKEYLLTLKTRAELFSECEAFIKKHHSYKVPQIIATEIVFGSKDYFDWIDKNTCVNGK